ncbi:MAG: hypothetical protein J6Q82_05875 [Clostridia bacterium]|nr:hypothetical protein [Clostridia bacterium]
MFYLLFSLVFVIIALLYVLNGMRKGKKYIWSYSLARLIVEIVSAIASAFLSAGISFAIFKAIFATVAEGSGTLSGLLTALPIMSEALCAIASMIMAPILFYIIFGVLRIVLNLAAKIVLRSIAKRMAQKKNLSEESEEVVAEEAVAEEAVAEEADVVTEIDSEESFDAPKKKRKKDKKHKDDGYFRIHDQKNPRGRLCGALCGLVLFFATMIPAVGMLGVLNHMTAWGTAGETHPVIQSVASIVDAGANNIGSKAVRAMGGDLLYSAMTTYQVGDEKATLAKETNLLGVMGHALSDVSNEEIPRADAANTVREIDEAFRQTTLIPMVAPEFLNASKDSWDRGEAYYGIKKPSFGKMDGLVHPILDVLGNSTKETVRDDVATLVNSIAYMVEKGALTDIKDNPMNLFRNQDVTSEIIQQLLQNDHLAPLVGEISEFGLDLFGEVLNVSMDDIDLDSSKIQNSEAESVTLSIALVEMANITEQSKTGGFEDANSIASIGPLMDTFAATETIGEENSEKILNHMFRSERIYLTIGFSYEEALDLSDTINEKSKVHGYTPVMLSLSQTVEVIQMTQKDDQSSEEMVQKMEVLIKDLTPESSEVLQKMSSPTVMMKNGVAEQSAEPTANMVSDVFGNLSDAKENGMSEDEYNKEAKAVTDLLNLSMNANNSKKSTTFGEGSATGKSADEVVNSIFDSKVVSKTVRETVYEDTESPDPQIDPLNSQKKLTEAEQHDLVEALNNRWVNATEEEKNDSEYQQNYYAVAALMNMSVQITADGIVAA